MNLMLYRFRLLSLLIIMALPILAMGQAIDNSPAYKRINSSSWVRLNYENDVFSATDKYYTQGISLEIATPALSKFPLTKILLRPHGGRVDYGIAAEHNGYTPTSISNPSILKEDRPFAACLLVKTFAITTDVINKRRISSSLSTGVIGPAAGGMEMQTGIHRWLHNITPHGWPNQVHNDVILNYQAGVEYQLAHYSNYFALNAEGMARLGTLSDKAAGGVHFMIGYFDSPYTDVRNTHKHLRIYAYEQALINVVGYDATMQGGLFNHTSPYTLPASAITRTVFQNRFGFVVNYAGLSLEYFQSFLSPEFKTGAYHVWGGVQIAYGFGAN